MRLRLYALFNSARFIGFGFDVYEDEARHSPQLLGSSLYISLAISENNDSRGANRDGVHFLRNLKYDMKNMKFEFTGFNCWHT